MEQVRLAFPELRLAAMDFLDAQKLRLAMDARNGDVSPHLLALEHETNLTLQRELRKHPVWPWLKEDKGRIGGARIAVVLSMMDDPHRFKGVRSWWHYCGLHVVAGKLPRPRRGVKSDWNPSCRTACLMPNGIADQIIKHRADPYRTTYDKTKARIQFERGVEHGGASDAACGPALIPSGGVGVDSTTALGTTDGLRPFQIHAIARTVAVKAYMADLLVACKAAS